MVRIITELKKINFSKYSKPSDAIIKATASVIFLLSQWTDLKHTPLPLRSRDSNTHTHTQRWEVKAWAGALGQQGPCYRTELT